MADVQLENGFTKIANELLDAIQSFRFTQNQFKLLLALWRNTYGWNRKQCKFSTNDIVSQTGLQRTRVIETLQSLIESNVVIEIKPPVGTSARVVEFNKNYAEWTIQKYKGVEVRGTQSETPRVPQNDTPENARGTQNDTWGVLNPAPPRGTQNDTPRGTQSGTPLNKKEIINTKEINTAAANGVSNVVDYSSKNYTRNLLNRFVQLRGSGLFHSPKDEQAAEELLKAGVPLQTSLEGMEEVFRDYQPKHTHDKIKSLSYCVGRIMDKHFGRGSAKPKEKSLFDPSPETLKRQQEQIEKYKGKEIDMTGLPY